MSYVDANGVHTYYEEHGSGDPLLLLLHGGLVDGDSFAQQTPVFAEHYRVIVPDRRGHGRTPDVEGPISYELMADDTIAFMEALGTGPAHLVGWSDGGNVGLLVAIKRPDLVRQPRRHRLQLQRRRADDRGGGLVQARHADLGGPRHARDVEGERRRPGPLRRGAGEDAAAAGSTTRSRPPTSPGSRARRSSWSGDDDITRFEHTIELYDTIPDAQLAVIPGASHLAPIEKAELVNQLVLDFLAAEGPDDDHDAAPAVTFGPGGGTIGTWRRATGPG